MISCLVPFKNDFELIDEFLDHLLLTAGKNTEVVICNDGSVFPSGKFRPLTIDRPGVRVINIPVSRGVGFAFDRCAEQCSNDIIVLQGIDTFARQGWYHKVIEAVNQTPDSIGCAVCIGLSETNHDLDNPKNVKRYGADLLVHLDIDDLPLTSELRVKKPNYRDIFKGKWTDGKKSDEPYEISCLMGALYFTTKAFYQKIGGFDTLSNVRYRGHRVYGSLEPYLSLKAWLSGGSCILYPDIEAGHVFARWSRAHRYAKGARSAVDMFFNKLFITESMVLDPVQRNTILNYPLQELNLNRAKQLIKRNYIEVLSVRNENRERFTRDLTWFMEKFGICLK